MKICSYYFDHYTHESIWIATILWPIYVIPFYFYFKNITFSIISALILASFSCLIFSDNLIEYMVYFLGFSILLFGSMTMCIPSKKSIIYMFIGIMTSLLSSVILYLMRVYVYNRKTIPDTKGDMGTLLTIGPLTWNFSMIIMYIYIFYYILKKY